MVIPLSTSEKLLHSHWDKREMAQSTGFMAFTLTATGYPKESFIMDLSKVFPNHYKFRATE